MFENDQASPRSNNLMENKAKTDGDKPKKSLTKNTLVSIERMEDYCQKENIFFTDEDKTKH